MVDTAFLEPSDQRRRHWRGNLRLTGALMLVWFLVSFVAAFFARELSQNFFGWPLSFYMAAQGALLIYVVLVWCYARCMRRLDVACGVGEDIA
jgi:putative solute:sodium symporter small subunit